MEGLSKFVEVMKDNRVEITNFQTLRIRLISLEAILKQYNNDICERSLLNFFNDATVYYKTTYNPIAKIFLFFLLKKMKSECSKLSIKLEKE